MRSEIAYEANYSFSQPPPAVEIWHIYTSFHFLFMFICINLALIYINVKLKSERSDNHYEKGLIFNCFVSFCGTVAAINLQMLRTQFHFMITKHNFKNFHNVFWLYRKTLQETDLVAFLNKMHYKCW